MLNMTTRVFLCLTLLSLFPTILVCYSSITTLIEWEIMNIMSIKFLLPIIIDPSSMIFLSTVLIITTSVMQFSKLYMMNDKFLDRFILLVICFVMSMILLIYIPNMITFLMGWDGLGITSFILVVYYQNPKSLGAGLITALTNRVGDVMLLLSIALTANQGHWYITSMWHNSSNMSSIIILMIMIAGMTKSAQIPFSSWLPAAMAAPTPVSALVHSSTLVTAGVYILYRFYPFLTQMKFFNMFLTLTATMTMLMAGSAAMSESDMKKIIALSTLSQLGVMMFALGVNLPQLTFFHLITHALFKALLFICAGTLIDIHHHSQDLRSMGSTLSQMPLTISSMSAANMALCGMPFLAGFFSKDLIIESYYSHSNNSIILLMFMTATILTTAYSVRFSLYLMLNIPHSIPAQYSSEYPQQLAALPVLSIGAITGGAIINWLIISPHTDPPISLAQKLNPLILMILGILLGMYAFLSKSPVPKSISYSQSSMWLLTPISTHFIIKPSMFMPLYQLKLTDQGWNEFPLLSLSASSQSSTINSLLQNNILTQQIYTALILSSCYIMFL